MNSHIDSEVSPQSEDRPLRRRFRSDRGAVGTEMAIIVAIVVTIAIAVGAIMRTAATNHSECIPENPTEVVPANCQ
jgi:hypothetical protein